MKGSPMQKFLVTLICVGLIGVTAAHAATGTVQLRTGSEPSAVCGTTSTASISIDIELADLSDPVNGVQVRIAYDDTVLSLNTSSSTELEGFTRVSLIDMGGLVIYTLINNGGSVGGGAGPFTVATLVFDVNAEGATDISFQVDHPPVNTRLTTAEMSPQIIEGKDLTTIASGQISIDDTTTTATNNGPVCEGESLTLDGGTTGTLPNPPYTFVWTGPEDFTSDEEDPLVSASASVAMSGNYTLTVTNAQGCTFQAMTSVTVDTPPVAPDSASVDPDSYCASDAPEEIELTAVGGSGDTLEWYDDECGGNLIGTGSPLMVSAPAVTTTYYARWTNACGSTTCAETTVTVLDDPVAPDSASVDPDSYCASDAPEEIELTAVGGSGDTLEWYDDECGGNLIGTGSPLMVSAPAVTTTYYARWTNACGSTTCAETTVTVLDDPVAPDSASVDPDSYCASDAPEEIELTAVGGSGDTLEWYDDECGGNLIGTGSPLMVSAPAVTTTYYARWTNACGSTTCAETTVTVLDDPVAPDSASVDPDSYCASDAPEEIELTAVGGSGDTLEWYDDECGGNLIGTGSPLMVSAPAVTTTYYARWTNACGSTNCAETTVTVFSVPACSITLDSSVCAVSSSNIATGPAGMASYDWIINGGALDSGQGTDEITYTAGAGPIVTIELTVTDANGCMSSCEEIVSVDPCITINLTVEGLNGNTTEGAPVADRSVRFNLTTCPGIVDTRIETVSFVRTGSNGAATVTLTNVNADATWLSIVEGHTLRRLVPIDLSGDNSDTVTVTLIAGDFHTATVAQDNFVDIVDFSILASRWNTVVSDCGGGNPEDCSMGADANGDGIQTTADFTAIQINFLTIGDPMNGCAFLAPPLADGTATSPLMTILRLLTPDKKAPTAPRGRASIDVAELRAIDAVAVAADLDGNGVIDGRDIRAFAVQNGLTLLPEFEIKLQQIESAEAAQSEALPLSGR